MTARSRSNRIYTLLGPFNTVTGSIIVFNYYLPIYLSTVSQRAKLKTRVNLVSYHIAGEVRPLYCGPRKMKRCHPRCRQGRCCCRRRPPSPSPLPPPPPTPPPPRTPPPPLPLPARTPPLPPEARRQHGGGGGGNDYDTKNESHGGGGACPVQSTALLHNVAGAIIT